MVIRQTAGGWVCTSMKLRTLGGLNLGEGVANFLGSTSRNLTILSRGTVDKDPLLVLAGRVTIVNYAWVSPKGKKKKSLLFRVKDLSRVHSHLGKEDFSYSYPLWTFISPKTGGGGGCKTLVKVIAQHTGPLKAWDLLRSFNASLPTQFTTTLSGL